MKIREISLRGWKSYSPNGVVLKDLKKMNLIIGPNNSGKTNLNRFFSSLKDLFHHYDNQNLILTCHVKQDETRMSLDGDVSCLIKVEVNGKVHDFETIRSRQTSKEIFKVNNQINQESFDNWRKLIKNRVKLFSDVRGYKYNNTGMLEHHVDGKRVADYIFNKGINSFEWYQQYREDMSRWLSNLLNVEVVVNVKLENPSFNQSPYVDEQIKVKEIITPSFFDDFDPILERAEFEIKIKRSSEYVKHEPQDLGMGVLQFILILSALYVQKDIKCFIFLEEPELNLHAKSITELIDILETDEAFINHQYFIVTHSNVILDKINENYSVHRFEMNEFGSTNVTCCTNKIDSYAILDVLGVHPSQLLQSNLVIWVEGPSDRVYIKKWIELYSKKRGKVFIEGKHYSFVFYGGSLLDHYSVLKEDTEINDLIDFLNTSRYAVIICDSDIGGTRKEYKDRVKRIEDRLNNRIELEPYVYQWITDGREIENYVPKDLFSKVITEQIKHREYFSYNQQQHAFNKPNTKIIEAIDFDKSYSFDEFFARMYIREEEAKDKNLVEAIIKNVSKSFDKVEIAQKVSKLWDVNEIVNKDLENRIEKIIQMLEKANE
ncbi:AAA family ATPase [Bacillus sp. R1-10]